MPEPVATLRLGDDERAMLAGGRGAAAQRAMRIVVDAARLLGADRLVEIASAHIDGCLYHGDGGVLFAELLVADGGRVAVPTTLNVGALDLVHHGRVRLTGHEAAMAARMTRAYEALGCRPSWTCAPYQAGHRPALGQHVAWGESNAIVFCNSVLGARTARYGDFLDICCALIGRAPNVGLHRDEARRATVTIDAGGLPRALVEDEAFYPVLGAWLGRETGGAVAAIVGLPPRIEEDRLKALGAAAASTGAVGLFHVVGCTPEAPDLATAGGGAEPRARVALTTAMLRGARATLSTHPLDEGAAIDAVAIGSPHLSHDEIQRLLGLLAGRRSRVTFYACTGRHVLDALSGSEVAALAAAGIDLVVDTCVVVTPIFADGRGVVMTNSGKFAHYMKPNTGRDVVFGTLADCVESAVAGRLVRDERTWS
ncbi:MAG: aconitase X catalytic domain-containing protein [Alphaproteobacteria bacterium]|nr:aconitase X catalytic domain-containing protein [Alphaproteobacteria bacterium]